MFFYYLLPLVSRMPRLQAGRLTCSGPLTSVLRPPYAWSSLGTRYMLDGSRAPLAMTLKEYTMSLFIAVANVGLSIVH